MKIKSISFENYKAFKENQTLELNPITLLVGKNSSGKSVITKLFTLLDNSLSRNIKEPLLLNNYGVELGAEFRDLVYGREPNSPISFKIEYQDDTTLFVKVIQPINSHKIEFLEWEFNPKETNIKYQYETKIFLIENKALKFRLNGFIPDLEEIKVLLPKLISIHIEDEYTKGNTNILNNFFNYESDEVFSGIYKIHEFVDIIKQIKINIDYIAPFRVLPERQYYFKGETAYNSINTNGEDAYQILIDSYLSNKIAEDENSIYNKVSKWYENKFGWKLEIAENKSSNSVSYHFLLSKDNIKVNLADVGQGMHQALPLVVRAYMAVEDSIVVMEQPELHLHTSAHADLAELFARSAKTKNQTFVIETHAENMLLRLRKLVIDNDFGFTKDDIIIYWVGENENGGQKITPITIDEEGTLSKWFDDAFDENLAEIFAIDKAIAKKIKIAI